MTNYESAKIFITAYERWQSLWQWHDLFNIGIHCESTDTDLLKTPRAKILERSQAVLGPALDKKYLAAVALIDSFNVDFQQTSLEARKEMDRTHVQMLRTCFPKDANGSPYTVYDRHTGCTIGFSMGGHYVNASVARSKDEDIFGYFDFTSPDIGAKHCRFNINKAGKVDFTTQDDCY